MKQWTKKLKILPFILTFFIISQSFGISFSNQSNELGFFTNEAFILNDLGLFQGTNEGFDLLKAPTRIEALVMFVRLIGAEAESEFYKGDESVFLDVPPWAVGYANYAHATGLTTGIGNQLFGSNRLINAQQFMTYVLRALGYEDAFHWDESLDFAYEQNLISLDTYFYLNESVFLRDHMVLLSYKALNSFYAGEDYTLLENLAVQDKVYLEAALYHELVSENPLDYIMRIFVQRPSYAYDVDEVNRIVSRLSKIPVNYLRILAAQGVRFRPIHGKITDEPEYTYLRGVTPRGWEGTGKTWDDIVAIGGNPVVMRIGYSDMGLEHGSYNLELHETAHVIDTYVFSRFGFSSYDEAFRKIAQAEHFKLFPGDPYFAFEEEFFAEAFTMYYLNPETRERVRTYAPITYELFGRLERLYGH